ncbi:hypothetical protein CF319_g2226 [Tilletia indica]|nr:hypothetical protein CF319_g2226 [Tilletia indica]
MPSNAKPASIAPASVDKRQRVNAWETVKKSTVDVYVEDQDGKTLRPKDVKFCRHGDKAMCDYCMPLEICFDERHRLSRDVVRQDVNGTPLHLIRSVSLLVRRI